MTPNRSLSAKGRLVCIALVASPSLLIALGAAVVGAWPVLPFAGLDVALVCWAFHVVSAHDRDCESLSVVEDQIFFDARQKDAVVRLSGNREWARVEQVVKGGRCWLRLHYGGRQYSIGRLLNDEQRMAWATELRDFVKVTKSSLPRRAGNMAE